MYKRHGFISFCCLLVLMCCACTETVPQRIAVSSVVLGMQSVTMTVGESVPIEITVAPADAADKSVRWRSSDQSVVTVVDGVLNAVKAGEAVVTAESGGIEASCSVEVLPLYVGVETVALDIVSVSLKAGEEVVLTATVGPADATDRTVAWSSSDESVGSVSDGVFTAKKAGTATVTATSGEISATCTVAVFEPVPTVPAEAVDLGLSIKWAAWNIGATRPEEYGDYFAWGETEPYYEDGFAQENPQQHWKSGKSEGYDWKSYRWSDGTGQVMTKYCSLAQWGPVTNKRVLDPGDDVATVKWGDGWFTPTIEDYYELINNCDNVETEVNGVKGRRYTSRINGNSIFLPAAGYRYYTSLVDVGEIGYYGQSCVDTDCPIYACGLFFDKNGNFSMSYLYRFRFLGRTVRPVTR